MSENDKLGMFPVQENQKHDLTKKDEQALHKLSLFMEEFFLDKPNNTAKAYRSDLKKFYQYTSENFKIPNLKEGLSSFASIERLHVVKYKAFLQSSGGMKGKAAAPLTIIRKLAAIKVWYDFLIEKGITSDNPANSVKRPRAVVEMETEELSDKEVSELFNIVDEYASRASSLHKAVITTLFTTGIRAAELRMMKLKDLKSRSGIYFFEYIGKGEKKHKVALHSTTVFYIGEYLNWMKEEGREVMPDDYIFQPTQNRTTGKPSHQLSESAVRYIVKHYASLVTVISSLLEAGEDLYRVSLAVQHSDPRTTKKYDKRGKKLKDSPLLNIKFYNDSDD
jgi:site-specific recombinase XerD